MLNTSFSFVNLFNSMLYDRDTFPLEDIKSVLHSKKLRQKLLVVGSQDQAEGLFVRDHTEKGQEKSWEKPRFKSRLRKNIKRHCVINLDTIQKIILSSKKKMLESNLKMRNFQFLVLQKKSPHHMKFFQLTFLIPFTRWVGSWFRLFLLYMSLQALVCGLLANRCWECLNEK